MIIGALLIKHKLNLSDVETVEAIRENPYMQYLPGLSAYTDRAVFDPSLFVSVRKRLGIEDYNDMSESLLKLQVRMHEEKQEEEDRREKNGNDEGGTAGESSDNPCSCPKPNEGLMKIDATCSDSEVRYPTDLDLLNDGVEVIDRILDRFCRMTGLTRPETRLKEIHSRYLNVIKLRKKPKGKVRECMEYMLVRLRRNVNVSLETFGKVDCNFFFTLKPRDRSLFFTTIMMWKQQKGMFTDHVYQCKDRIVSLFQPFVRPIVRGKAKAKVEFGAKIGVSVVRGYTFIDRHSWDAYNECDDLMLHLRAYRKRFGNLPAKVEADKIYMNRRNRQILRLLGIEIGGKPLGRPSKGQDTKEYHDLMARNVGERNEVEATFGTGKRIYRANNIRAKRADTGASWVGACYFVKNIKKFLHELLYALIEMMEIIKIIPENTGIFRNRSLVTKKTLLLAIR
jgi:PAS domain-containing protein